MLSRRRRVSSSSFLRYNENISVDINGNGVGKAMESHEIDAIATPALQASTETSTTSQCDNRMFGSSTRHVVHRNIVRNEEQRSSEGAIECRREAAGEEKSSDIQCNRVSNDISLAMSFTIQNSRRLTQCVRGSSRHRRRKSVEKLDRNVNVFQISCSTTNQRLAIDSSCSEITPSPQLSGSHEEIQDFQVSARISDIDRLNTPSSSIYPKIPDKDKISRTRHEIFEARTRINYHRHNDTVMEHKNTQRRNSEEILRGSSFTKETARSKKIRKIWSQWACRRNRWIVILGLLMWTTLMITEVTGRQNHHRTCPGCPHQHVHTINSKSGSFDEEADASSETETAPSPDDLRLEAIKHQILTKLGLRTRPDVNKTLASVPRHLALETLYRAEAQPPGHSIEPDDYHEGKRRDHRRGDIEDEDSLSSPSSSSSSSSSLSSSLSSSSSSLSSSLSSSSSSASSSSSKSSSSSSSSYGQFYYDGEEYSYRNVDQGALERGASSRGYEDARESPESGAYVNNERHRGHGDYRNGGKARNYHVTDDDDEGQIEMDDFYARTSEIISFAEPGRTLNGQPLLEFPQSSGDPALEPLRIKRATLWARVEFRHAHHYQHHRRAQANQRNITLWVFRVRCGNVTHLRGKELGEHLEMVTSLGVNINQLGWQKFDVTKVVSNWYSGHELSSTKNEKLTLLVDCTGCGSHVHVSTFGVQTPNVVESSINPKGGEDPDRPFLVVRTDPAAVKRVRRRAIECSGAIKGQCCKQRFYVSFSQLGWDDWIIAPQGYYANYCRGDCAAGHRTPDTFLNYYTHVIEEYRKMDRLAGMQPCCAPLKFSPMSLIYYGPDSNIIKRDLPKMVVDECGCP